MSQAVTASRGSASRTVCRSPSSGSPRCSAIRCSHRRDPCRRRPPAAGPGAARRARRARPSRRRRGRAPRSVAPIRRGSASTWIRRPESSSAYCPVVSAPSSVPTARRTSAPPEELAHGRLVQRRPDRQRVVLGEGALAHVGRRHRRAQPLRDRAQLLPGAGAEHAAAGPDDRRRRRRRAGGRPRPGARRRGAEARAGVASSSPGRTSVSPASTSTGISTKTGPLGGVSARRQASASSSGISPALSARAAHFTTGSKEAFWSGSSCRNPRPAPIRSRGIWLAIATTGTCALAASMSAASEMSAPGPVERRSGAGRPLVRA